MHLRKNSRALCTDGNCESLCNKEKAQGSSWSYNRSTMESVVSHRLVSVGKSFTLASGKSKDKLAPKFIASLLIAPIERKAGAGGSFLCAKARNKRWRLAHQLANVVAAPPEDAAWLVSRSAGVNRRGHGSFPRDNPGGFTLAPTNTSSYSTFGIDQVGWGICGGADLEWPVPGWGKRWQPERCLEGAEQMLKAGTRVSEKLKETTKKRSHLMALCMSWGCFEEKLLVWVGSFWEILFIDEEGTESCCPENSGSSASHQGSSSCHVPPAGPTVGPCLPYLYLLSSGPEHHSMASGVEPDPALLTGGMLGVFLQLSSEVT